MSTHGYFTDHCKLILAAIALTPTIAISTAQADNDDLAFSIETQNVYPVVPASSPEADYLTQFKASGQPKFDFHKSVFKRFGPKLNKGVDPASQSPEDRLKWTAIYNELHAFGNRTATTPFSLLNMDIAEANQWSHALETSGAISDHGAWSIAVEATAVIHDFAPTPCAEFQSEIIRESYRRAGYQVTDDFNADKGNQLIWSNSAAVVELSHHLYVAGWIPWETRHFRPMIGSIMMNGSGETPGHTYIAAGYDGSLIVDNGYPQGRDLHATSEKTITMEYMAGVFFLPPGFNPQPW